ncbi:MAG: type 1 glutamine amidotransferase domain-containing protein [Albidovulum sp.]
MNNPRILIIATSAARMSSGKPTGLWLDELTTPYFAFADAGAEVTVGSIAGGEIPVDARSLDGEPDPSAKRARKDLALSQMLAESEPVGSFRAEDFDAIFLPGGHGTMFDFPESAELARLVEAFDRAGKIVAAVCHGPVGLVSARRADGKPLVAGRRVAGFTDSEEALTGLDGDVPFLLESRLRWLGANYQKAPDFQPFAVTDGNLVTGQNPQSAPAVAAGVLSLLANAKAAA